MIVTLTPNPSIDRVLIVPGFRRADVRRVAERRDDTGGKGVNVARVIATLGEPTLVCGPLGGITGGQIAALAAAEGLPTAWTTVAGESRICLLITDADDGDTLTINERGPQLAAEDWERFAADVQRRAAGASALTCSGSLPPGVLPDQLFALLSRAAAPVYLDTSGAALLAALGQPFAAIKVNGHEIGEALGIAVETPEQAAVAAREVVRRGAARAIVTLGAGGAVAADATGAWHAAPPSIRMVSPVGSGDAVLSGAVVAIARRSAALPDALRLGVACGTANALTAGAGSVAIADIERIYADVTLRDC